jgi:hypothetical protein
MSIAICDSVHETIGGGIAYMIRHPEDRESLQEFGGYLSQHRDYDFSELGSPLSIPEN